MRSPARRTAEAAARELFGKEALWVPYTDPGYRLAKLMQEMLKAYRAAHGGDPRIVLMQNHGLVVAADTTAEIRSLTDEVLRKISARFRGPVPREERSVTDAVVRVLPGLRMLLSGAGCCKSRRCPEQRACRALPPAGHQQGVTLPFMPDDIVYCKSAPLLLPFGGDPEELFKAIPAALQTYKERWGYAPKILLIAGLGRHCGGGHQALRGNLPGRVRRPHEGELAFRRLRRAALPLRRDIQFIDTWEVENYRRAVAKGAAARRRAEGRIALVTGAAQGFGKGIAEGLFREGANVVIADLNEAAGRSLQEELNAGAGAAGATNRALFVPADVTSPDSLQRSPVSA